MCTGQLAPHILSVVLSGCGRRQRDDRVQLEQGHLPILTSQPCPQTAQRTVVICPDNTQPQDQQVQADETSKEAMGFVGLVSKGTTPVNKYTLF